MDPSHPPVLQLTDQVKLAKVGKRQQQTNRQQAKVLNKQLQEKCIQYANELDTCRSHLHAPMLTDAIFFRVTLCLISARAGDNNNVDVE